jgi:prevent-host-death family protein
VVRRVKSDGPQVVTVHGRAEVVVISAQEFHELKNQLTGRALVDLMRDSPLGDAGIEHEGLRLPVRDVIL